MRSVFGYRGVKRGAKTAHVVVLTINLRNKTKRTIGGGPEQKRTILYL